MDYFITRDHGIATYLVYRKHRVEVVPSGEGRRLVYKFPQSPELRADFDAYTAGAKVAAVDYFGAVRILRRVTNEAFATVCKAAQ